MSGVRSMVIKVLFLDIDGTLTENRDTYELSLDAIRILRGVVKKGILVSLVSSNALPIVVGLSRYIGLNGPVIGESGCLVYYDKWGFIELASKSAVEPYRALLGNYGMYVEDSWQNRFRLYDFALKLRKEFFNKAGDVLRLLRGFLEKHYPGFTVDYSGYALHVKELGVDKKRAVLYVLSRLGIDPGESAGIGDSVMDVDFLSVVGFSAAVANADEDLKKRVSMVLSKPSGLGVVEFIEKYV